ncbi:MAG: hypothetical protein D6689_07395 [Deltaproteobacteria bacterium]|nr:MAG: hypothetical protein D6689_07395 [Deltaproteobacteria bacterium]
MRSSQPRHAPASEADGAAAGRGACAFAGAAAGRGAVAFAGAGAGGGVAGASCRTTHDDASNAVPTATH